MADITCSKCNEMKDTSLFYTRTQRKRGFSSECKDCYKKRHKDSLDGYFSVYYLPEEHYVGMTNSLQKRLGVHKRSGRTTEGFEVVGKFKRAIDAHLLETMLHSRDYLGFGGDKKIGCYG